MIAEMSKKSKIYHRPGCKYINRIEENSRIAFDMDDGRISNLKPCKCCCSIKGIYESYKPFLSKVFMDLDISTELDGEWISVHTNWYDWKIGLKRSSQNMGLYQEQWDEELGATNLIKRKDVEKTKNLESLMMFIAKEERVAFYPEPYRMYALKIESYVQMNPMQIEYDGNKLYVLTDMAAWKIVYCENSGYYKLYHCPFSGSALTMEQAKTAYYHRQQDVPLNQSAHKHVKYIHKHDEAMKIAEKDYRKLPQKTRREKRYYRQAENRAKRRSVNKVYDIFAEIEAKEGIKELSFC